MNILNRTRRAIFGMNEAETRVYHKMINSCLELGIEYITLQALGYDNVLSSFLSSPNLPPVGKISDYQHLELRTVVSISYKPRLSRSFINRPAAKKIIDKFFEGAYRIICEDESREGKRLPCDRVLCDKAKELALYRLEHFEPA